MLITVMQCNNANVDFITQTVAKHPAMSVKITCQVYCAFIHAVAYSLSNSMVWKRSIKLCQLEIG